MSPVDRGSGRGSRSPAALLVSFIAFSAVVAAILRGAGSTEAFGAARTAGEVLLWALLFAVIIGILGLYTSKRIIEPLASIFRGARILRLGNISHRIYVRTGGKLEAIADTLNSLAANLEASRHQLEIEHTQAVRSAEKAQTLYRVSQALTSGMDLQTRLQIIADNLAAVCETSTVAIWLIEGNHLIPYASYGLNPEQEELFHTWEVHIEEATKLTQQAISEQQPIVSHDATSDERVPRELAMLLNVRSLLALPFVFEAQTIGYAVTYEPGVLREFTPYQVSLARAVAAQAAVAIENARAYERERRIAETLQRSFLPAVPGSVGDFEIADEYSPALREAEIGGDFYDVFQLTPEKVGLLIADISGKGLSAGVHTAMVKYMLRAYAMEETNPAELVSKLNAAVHKYIGGEAFVTLFYGVLDISTRELVYVNAGHELPLLYGEDRRICMRLATTGTALGILGSYDFGMDRIAFTPGDVLLMYTDGATDARRDRQFLGVEGLEQIFCSVARLSAHRIVGELSLGIRDWAQGVLHDDVALLVVKYRRPLTPGERAVKHEMA